MAMLDARDIHVRFGDRVVLEDISFAVEPGELHGIMGPNGAGKTTFFNVLTGRVKPSRGTVRIDGEDVTGLAVARDRGARHRALVPDHDAVRRVHGARERRGGAAGVPRPRLRRPPRAPSAIAASRARRGRCSPRSASPRRRTSSRRTCPMATAARSRSPSRSRSARACSASTSRPPASAPTASTRLASLIARLKGRLVDRRDRARHGVPVRPRRPHLGGALGPGHRPRHAGRAASRTPGCSARISGGCNERGRRPAAPSPRPRRRRAAARGRRHPHLLRRDAGAVRRLASRSRRPRSSRCSARTAPARRRRCARSSA